MITFAFDVLSLSLLSTNPGTFPVSTNFTSLAFSPIFSPVCSQFNNTVYSFVSPAPISGITFISFPSCSSHVPSLFARLIPSGMFSSIVAFPLISPVLLTFILYSTCTLVSSAAFL